MSAIEARSILVADIIVGARLRQPRADEVAKLCLSLIESRRLIQPIIVRAKGAKFELVAGGTRLAAAKKLNWSHVDVVVKELNDEQAALEETDENLYRSDLTGAELTRFWKRRLELFMYQGGELRRGRDGRKSANMADLKNPEEARRFYTEMQEKFGIKRRTAERLVRRARNIPDRLMAAIEAVKKPLNGSFLDKIAELQPSQRAEMERLVCDEGKELSEAFKIVAPADQLEPLDIKRAISIILPAWTAWSPKERREFQAALKRGGSAK